MSNLMKSRFLIFAALLSAGACEDLGTAPALDEAQLTPEDQIALSVLDNPLAVEAALGLAGAGRTASPWHSSQHSLQSAAAQRARQHFDGAVAAMRRGDIAGAAQEAAGARNLVAEQVLGSHGSFAVAAMVERMEDLSVSAAADPGRPQDAALLGRQLGMLAASARDAMQRGNMTVAAALGVMGEQLIAYHSGRGSSTMTGLGAGTSLGQGGGMGHGHGMGNGSGMGHGNGLGNGQGQHGWMYGGSTANVELMVALGATAVDLAEETLADKGAEAEQAEYLAAAKASLALAQEALTAGNLAQSLYLAGLAQWQALKAVVLPGGVTQEEVGEILALAQSLYEEAVTSVGDGPSALEADLLARADAMIQMALGHQGWRGSMAVSPLWRAAVIAAYVLAGAA